MAQSESTSDDIAPAHCTVPGLVRGLAALQAFSTRRPRLTIGELATHLGAPRNSVARLAQSLVMLGLLDMDAKGRMTPGPSALRIADVYLRSSPIVGHAQPILQALATRCGTSAQLLAHDRHDIVVIAQALPPTEANGYRSTRVGARFAPIGTMASTGGILLLTDDMRERELAASASRADIVAREVGAQTGGRGRFAVGLAMPVGEDALVALSEAARSRDRW